MRIINIVLFALSTAAYGVAADASVPLPQPVNVTDQITFNDGSTALIHFTFDLEFPTLTNISGTVTSPGISPDTQTIGVDNTSIFNDFGTSSLFTSNGNTYLQVDWFSSQAQISANSYTFDLADVYLVSGTTLVYPSATDQYGLVAKLYGDGNSSSYQTTVSSISQESLTSVPLPAAFPLFSAALTGLLGLGVSRKKLLQA